LGDLKPVVKPCILDENSSWIDTVTALTPEVYMKGRSISPRFSVVAGTKDSATAKYVKDVRAICQALAGWVEKVGGDPPVV